MVRVADGSYSENVTIGKSLILKGDGAPILNGAGSGTGISVTATGVTIAYLRIQNYNYGIDISAAGGAAIHHCNILRNSLYGLRNQNPGTTVNAENNWWGYTRSEDISRTISEVATEGAVDYTPCLTTCAPKLTALSAAKIGTRVRFILTFDRPMDTSIRTLRFGKYSPFKTYAATGTWNSAGTVWTAWRSRVGLPTGVWMYFSGAKDLPGTPMLSTSKRFKL